jgi:TDG/mug DNA glycosylase family protein
MRQSRRYVDLLGPDVGAGNAPMNAARHDQSARPDRAELEAAEGRSVRDVIAPDLDVLFCGINPGLWSGAVGHHFAHPGNRFWKALHASGFTQEVMSPRDERRLLDVGLGVTNLVNRATASADRLSRDEMRRGARTLARKAHRWRPRFVAVLGLAAYRVAFSRPDATIGEQSERLGRSRVWLLPNPSGAQGHYRLEDLVAELRALRQAVDRTYEPEP